MLDASARRHGPRAAATDRLARLRDGLPEPEPAPPPAPDAPEPERAPAPLPPAALDLLDRLRAAGVGLLSEAQIDDAGALRALRDADLAVRVSGRLYAHAETVAEVSRRVVALLGERGSLSLGELRDELATSRKSAQAFLELLDRDRVTRRGADDRRTLATRAVPTR